MGDLPSSGGTELNAAILTQSRFTTPEQFGNSIRRANPDGAAVTLSDVARVELGAQTYLFDSELNGKPVAALAVQMTPGANALATAEAVKTRMAQLAETFPSDINWTVPYDTTLLLREAINEDDSTRDEGSVLALLCRLLS